MPFITDLADKLRSYTAPDGSKLTVVETSGWKTRGYAGQGMASVEGVLWHHTATAEAAYARSNAPTLNILINGHSFLPGPLSQLSLGRDGTVYVVAAGLCNHAGTGSASGLYRNVGNSYFIGIEMESSGVRDDWTAAQRRVMPHLGAALERGYGKSKDFIQIGHKEYSDQGKIDPAYIDMNALRQSINDLLYGGTTHVAPAAQNAAPATGQQTAVGNNLNAPHWTVRSGDSLGRIARYYFGSATAAEVKKIADYNGIKDANRISVGQRIFIPGPLVWTVQAGDSWEKIATYYGYSVQAVKDRNPSKSLTPGTVLQIWGAGER
ncbi:LysM peptidoglycan-binding domain-containing protein [Rothia nasimurium]|uniref:LysM peptidoglycan-binding domain-containing protein n=1 Tax=Rothia nasimurium TaxID=85336 RepID=UPI001F3D903A|nr:LysM peptidoglycan-binding domain-containing protein [Rothia nasimurium]